MFRKTLEDMINDEQEKLIVDLRAKKDYDKETYPGAIHIFHEEFYKYLDVLPKNKRIYLFCYTGVTGDEIAEDLVQKGYDIYSIEEGYRAMVRMNVHKMMNTGREEQESRNSDKNVLLKHKISESAKKRW